MKLKTQFFILGIALVAVSAATEVLNYQNRLISEKQQIAVDVIQRHMDADMKHDGMRGNVYSALVASNTGDSELLKESQEEVAAMSKEFVDDVEANLKENLPDESLSH